MYTIYQKTLPMQLLTYVKKINDNKMNCYRLIFLNNTLNISSYIFEKLDARWMITSGAHRYSSVDESTSPDCGNEYNFGADVARNQNDNGVDYTTPFQIFHEIHYFGVENPSFWSLKSREIRKFHTFHLAVTR